MQRERRRTKRSFSETPITQEQLNAFLVKLEGNRYLQETIRTAKSTEEVIDAAKSAGFAFSANGLNQPSKTTEEKLEEASGGQFGSYCMCHHKTLCKNDSVDL